MISETRFLVRRLRVGFNELFGFRSPYTASVVDDEQRAARVSLDGEHSVPLRLYRLADRVQALEDFALFIISAPFWLA